MASSKKQNIKLPFWQKYASIIFVAVISILGLLIYSNTYNVGFYLDDVFYIQNNDFLKDLSNFSNAKYWISINQRPLPTWTFALNYHYHEFSLPGYHIINILFHLGSAIIVFFLTIEILRNSIFSKREDLYKGQILAFVTALFFLSHPVQTQSVNYIVQRMTVMAGFFFLLSLLGYLKARRFHLTKQFSKSIPFYILAIMSSYFAVISKQNTVVLPLIFILVEILFLRNSDGKMAKNYTISFGILIFLGGLVVIFGGFIPKENDIITKGQYFATQMRVIYIYIHTLFLPVSLNFDPDIPISTGLFHLKEFLFVLGHLLILAFGISMYKKNKLITFGVFWFYITLLIESSFIPIKDVIFDHRLYLPAYGFVIILSSSLFLYLEKRKNLIIVTFSLVLISFLFSGMSYSRNKIWNDEIAFWKDIINQPPVKSRPYRFLGMQYIALQDYDNALVALNRALEIEPNRWQEHNNKAIVYKFMGEHDKVLDELNISLRLNSKEPVLYVERSDAHMKLNNFQAALEDLEKANKLKANDDKILTKLGLYYLKAKKNEEAVVYFEQSIKINPDNIDALHNNGVANLRIGNLNKAIAEFSKAINIDNNFRYSLQNRAEVYFHLGNYNKAILDYNHLILLDRKNGRAYKGRGLSFIRVNKLELALNDLNQAKQYGVNVPNQLFIDIKNALN